MSYRLYMTKDAEREIFTNALLMCTEVIYRRKYCADFILVLPSQRRLVDFQ